MDTYQFGEGTQLNSTGGGDKSAQTLSDNEVFIAYKAGDYLYGIICLINGTEITMQNNIQLTECSGVENTVLLGNRVLIQYNKSNRLYGIVCTISGTEITTGTPTQLNSIFTSKIVYTKLLESNKIFTVFSDESGYFYGIVCTVTDTIIVVETQVKLTNTTYSDGFYRFVELLNNKIFLYHSGSANYYLYGIVCAISGTTITKGTDTMLSYRADSALTYVSHEKLSDNSIFIAHGDKDDNLYGIVSTISGTTITAGTDTKLKDSTYAGRQISTLLLNENKVMITHAETAINKKSYLYGIICTISGTTITKGADTQLSTIVGSGYTNRSMLLLNENAVFITYSDENSYFYAMICTISGKTITKGIDTQLVSMDVGNIELKLVNNKIHITYDDYIYGNDYGNMYKIICNIGSNNQINIESNIKIGELLGSSLYRIYLKLNNNTIITLYTTSSGAGGIMVSSLLKKVILPVITSTDDIYGIAKTNGEEGQQIDVYRPYEEVAV